jgi:hypothetical protein
VQISIGKVDETGRYTGENQADEIRGCWEMLLVETEVEVARR